MENRTAVFAPNEWEDDKGLPPDDFPRPVLWEDLEKKNFPPQRWRINNLIPYEGLVFLASISGEGKSWLAMEIANAIVQEKDFLGHPEFKTVGGNVLYINGEMAESELQRRGKQLNLQSSKFKLHFLTHDLDLKETDPTGDDDMGNIDFLIKHNEISTVIIDTFRSVAGGIKEEKAEEIRIFLDRFKKYKNQGISIIFLEHNRKPSHFETKVPQKEHLFGSQDKVASVEVLLMIKTNEDTGQIYVYQRKNRLGIAVKPFKLSLTDTFNNNGQTSTILKYEGEIEEDDTKKALASEAIVELLENGGKTTKEILMVLSKDKRIGQKNTRLALNELRKGGFITSEKHGREDFFILPTNPNEPKTSDSCIEDKIF